MPYYNTIPLKHNSPEHKKNQRKEKSQKELVLDWFIMNKGNWSPADIWAYCLAFKDTPITSIRRSITDLTKEGFLEKTGEKKLGLFGQPNNTWRLRKVDNEATPLSLVP